VRVDLKPKGVRVTSIHPGFIKTEMTADAGRKLPFLLESDVAVEKMGRAIMRGDSEFAFPWQMSATLHVVKLLPNAVFDVAAKKLL
jgi:short-subunit dehydrogenase